MLGMNKAILIGVVDDNPRFYNAREGRSSKLTLRVRTDETYRDENGTERERRAWHSIVVWGRRAEALEPYLVRGKFVALEGRIVSSSWQGADGKRRNKTEIHAYEIVLLDRKPVDAQKDERDAA